ncbi:MAG: T9SS C-terminal target domain-containing protein [Cytophagales bacterium]|nr:MAG: T9SS C-terminal target domain-containing protein [Cytophagales bacterium]
MRKIFFINLFLVTLLTIAQTINIDYNYVNNPANRDGKYIKVCGNFFSNDGITPAIFINYDPLMFPNSELLIENCFISGKGGRNRYTGGIFPDWIYDRVLIGQNPDFRNHKITIRNCIFMGQNPNIRCFINPSIIKYRGIKDKFIFENNSLENVGGVWIEGMNWDDFGIISNALVKVRFNKAKNIDTRYSDGNNGYLQPCEECANLWHFESPRPIMEKKDFGVGNCKFFQTAQMLGMSNSEISWNEIINEPEKSQAGDIISLYESSGISILDPIKIHNNYISGSYPFPANADGIFPAGGIIVADGESGSHIPQNLNKSQCFTETFNNQVLSTNFYGVYVGNGHHHFVHDNTIISTGKLRNSNDFLASIVKMRRNDAGSPLAGICIAPHPNSGWCTTECLLKFKVNGQILSISGCGNNNWCNNLFSDNKSENNLVMWDTFKIWNDIAVDSVSNGNNKHFDANRQDIYNPKYLSNNNKLGCGIFGNLCEIPTYQKIDKELLIWKKKLTDNNINIGVIPNGPKNFDLNVPSGNIQSNYSAYNKVIANIGTTLLPNTTLSLEDFNFTVCNKNNNPNLRKETEILNLANENIFKFSVFPNPIEGILNITFEDENPKNLFIIDLNGKIVFQKNNIIENNLLIDLQQLSKGMYFLKLKGNNLNENQKLILK